MGNGRHISVNGRHISVNGRHTSVNGRHTSVNGMGRYTVIDHVMSVYIFMPRVAIHICDPL